MRANSIFLFVFLIIISCNGNNDTGDIKNSVGKIENEDAKQFSLYDLKQFKKLEIYDKNQNRIEEYFLIPDSVEVPDTLRNKQIVQIPIHNAVTLSGTHIAFLDALGKLDCISGVSDGHYVYNQRLRSRIESGEVKELGYEYAVDFELLLSLNPDLVTVYDINGTVLPLIEKLKKYHIPVVQINEYTETSPLAQAEWIKVFAEFFDEGEKADELFNEISKNYNDLKLLTVSVQYKPSVLLNMPWKGTWYVPGGSSNAARLIQDAGGSYIWKDTEEKHNIPLSIEDVYLKASSADFWLNPGQAGNLNDIVLIDNRLSEFLPIIQKRVYNRNKRMIEEGGLDYMETGIIRPDMILQDLIFILHPELLPDHELYFYKKLE